MTTAEKTASVLSKIISVSILVGTIAVCSWLLRLAQETFNPAGYGILLGFLMCACIWALWALAGLKKGKA